MRPHSLLLLLAIITLTNCKGKAQKTNINRVDVSPVFEIGMKYIYEYQKGKSISTKPETKDIKSSTEIELTILRSVGELKECSWKYGATSMIGIDMSKIDSKTKKLMNGIEGFEVKFLINKLGEIEEITNYENCKLFIEKMFKDIYELTSDKTNEEIETLIESVKSTYSTPDALISTYCPDITILFGSCGKSYITDSTYKSESELPNSFGGPNFPAIETTKIDTITEFSAKISTTLDISSNKLTEIMKQTFLEISKKTQKPFEETDIPKINMVTNSYCQYNYIKKMIEECFVERVTETDGIKQIQTVKLTLK